MNISALLWNGGYTMDNQFGLKSNYQCLIRGIVEYFLSKKDVKLHLIPHVVGGERGLENDYAVAYDIYEEYCNENLILAPLFFDPIVAKNYIAGMDFLWGLACILLLLLFHQKWRYIQWHIVVNSMACFGNIRLSYYGRYESER